MKIKIKRLNIKNKKYMFWCEKINNKIFFLYFLHLILKYYKIFIIRKCLQNKKVQEKNLEIKIDYSNGEIWKSP